MHRNENKYDHKPDNVISSGYLKFVTEISLTTYPLLVKPVESMAAFRQD
jgi:hypothetical protein